ncbi:MAG: YraN family protein [Chitinophagales bacterium]
MATHNDFGRMAEDMAAGWLKNQGYKILYRNWRYGRLEVDIIAEKESMLHFIEVKARSSKTFGWPEEGVDIQKIQNLIDAAGEFSERHPEWKRIQLDILSIESGKGGTKFLLLEDVYL